MAPKNRSKARPRKSKRLQKVEQKKSLDPETVMRRTQKSIENLERDNYLEDPQPDLVIPITYGTNEDSIGNRRCRRKRGNNIKRMKLAEYFKTRFAKTFAQLVEEDREKNPNGPNYTTARAPPSQRPPRHLCVVCGFFSKYNCTTCSARYCSISCYEIHVDTRCLKWVV